MGIDNYVEFGISAINKFSICRSHQKDANFEEKSPNIEAMGVDDYVESAISGIFA